MLTRSPGKTTVLLCELRPLHRAVEAHELVVSQF